MYSGMRLKTLPTTVVVIQNCTLWVPIAARSGNTKIPGSETKSQNNMIDPTTLYFSNVLVAMTAGLVSYLFGRNNPEYRSVRDWGLATLMIAVGTSLVFVRPVFNSEYVILVSNTLIILGMVLTYRSFRVFRGEDTRDIFGGSLVVAGLFATLLWQFGLISEGPRSALITGILAVVLWRIVWLFISEPLAVARIAQRATIITYIVYASLNTARTLAALLGSTSSVLDPSLIEVIYVSGNTILWISVTLCVIWMVVERQHGALENLAMHDPLTGALNRNALLKAFKNEHNRAQRDNSEFALLLFDIDHFKQINDTHGHLVGDKILREFVEGLGPLVRQTDSIGRYGGEEFVVQVTGAGKDIALIIAERIRDNVARHGFDLEGTRYDLTVSVGVVVYPHHGDNWDTLIAKADAALYRAKGSGRNQVIYVGDLEENRESLVDPVLNMALVGNSA